MLPVLRGLLGAPQVRQVWHPRLVPPQPEGVDRFEESRVPQGGKGALAAADPRRVDSRIQRVEQRLYLVIGERTAPGPSSYSEA
jgi:hypothetical protein